MTLHAIARQGLSGARSSLVMKAGNYHDRARPAPRANAAKGMYVKATSP